MQIRSKSPSRLGKGRAKQGSRREEREGKYTEEDLLRGRNVFPSCWLHIYIEYSNIRTENAESYESDFATTLFLTLFLYH